MRVSFKEKSDSFPTFKDYYILHTLHTRKLSTMFPYKERNMGMVKVCIIVSRLRDVQFPIGRLRDFKCVRLREWERLWERGWESGRSNHNFQNILYPEANWPIWNIHLEYWWLGCLGSKWRDDASVREALREALREVERVKDVYTVIMVFFQQHNDTQCNREI